jgi:hypothetical protein
MSSKPFEQPDFEGEFPADFATEFPADLAALGEQLQADAQRLSSTYPACRAPTELPKELPKELNDSLAVRNRQWWMRRELSLIAASAATLLVVAGLVTFAYAPWSRPVVQQAADPSPPVESVAEVQPVSFQAPELSGPALEGLLDLLQENPQAAATSISF